MRASAAGILLCGLVGCALSVAAQTESASKSLLAACGDEKTAFAVSRGDVGDQIAAPEDGKAAVYIVELYNLRDKGRFNRPTIRHGLDGAWLGATQGFTYVSAAVDPGEHHLCSRWQSHFGMLSDQVSLYNFNAEAGKRYYFRVQITVEGSTGGAGPVSIDLEPVAEDEGRFLVSEAAQSVSKPKK
jgi:hypothetical protein